MYIIYSGTNNFSVKHLVERRIEKRGLVFEFNGPERYRAILHTIGKLIISSLQKYRSSLQKVVETMRKRGSKEGTHFDLKMRADQRSDNYTLKLYFCL